MKNSQCECGYQATSDDDLADHLGEWLIPRNDTAPDGQLHAEAAIDAPPVTGPQPTPQAPSAFRCLCGGESSTAAALDAHLLAAFTPPDAIHRPTRQSSPD